MFSILWKSFGGLGGVPMTPSLVGAKIPGTRVVPPFELLLPALRVEGPLHQCHPWNCNPHGRVARHPGSANDLVGTP